ncbi:type II CRISPR RNA-guided endonuclease Cas9 [Levilactobacillus enshiensis]|uniref:type II CRISPR RNA-guided endonuclease Cas9 n=1 Tax=Levilactobacillus enshiensis TaxID=2590213 RepID=UPI00117AED38|nr:type II CRISPR RNA-guided endonuclease Cas9 [Levilactobacillus enshiensis]
MKKKYGIGLDIGTSSIGWSVVDENGHIIRVKGQMGLGTRLFEEGQTAEERRGFRTTRRRLSRRRWRLRLLREIFDGPISSLDPNFFARQKESNLAAQDERFQEPYRLFDDLPDKDFYKAYPTIYHLRWALMTKHRKFDIREIYLAIHHIVKYRGNFLRHGAPSTFKPGKLDFGERFDEINGLWETLFDEEGPVLPTENLDEITQLVLDTSRSRADRQREMVKQLMALPTSPKDYKPVYTELAKSILGLKTKLYVLMGKDIAKADQKTWTFSLADIEDNLPDIEGELDTTDHELIEKLVDFQAAIQLTEIIPSGQYFSQSMVEKYNTHAKHLKWLKEYADEQTEDKKREAIRLSYDHYIDGDEKGKAEIADDFYKELGKVLKDDHSDLAEKISHEIDLENFMPKQRTKENGVIPYQIQQQELDLIINNQKQYYPFLGAENPVVSHRGAHSYKLDELVCFRVPYYVGPMITPEKQAQTATGQFAWMVRKTKKDSSEITPWNFEDKVDRIGSANAFIQRMKTTDTYLIGEDVLPLESLTYQKFMVLNELNNVRIDNHQLSIKQKQRLFNQLFKTHWTVSRKLLQENLRNSGDVEEAPRISGLADPKKFNSGLTTYQDLKSILPDEIDDLNRRADLEKIINWSTVFEDQKIFREKLGAIDWLTDVQRERLSHKRYRGWGRLSARLLNGVKGEQGKSVMKQLWESQNNFMQIVNQSDISEQIEKINAIGMTKQNVFDTINDLYTSPQNKKAIRQVLAVVKDIQAANHGVVPSWIYLEAARGAEQNPRRTQQRQRQLENLYADRAKEIVDSAVAGELQTQIKSKKRMTDRYMLYFLQNGRDMYTGEKLNIDNLSGYDIDHILPQSLVKDDSLDNRVLVHQKINRDKNDAFASEKFAEKMRGKWEMWHAAGLVSDRKLKHLLMRPSEISKHTTGFINRQLVETRQIIKLVTDILSSQYDPQQTKLVSVKAGLSHQLREELDLPKLRDLNDYHHAFDAFLAARIGTYLLKRYSNLESFFVYGKFQISKVNLRRFNFVRDLIGQKKIGNLASENQIIYDQATGEVLWNRDDEVGYFLKILNWKHLLVTQEVVENHGALFNQTIYKAKDNQSRRLIATKQNRPTAIYGGYSGQNIAYLAIIRVHSKKQDYLKVMGVPISLLTKLRVAREQGIEQEKAVLKQHYLPEFITKSGKTTDFDIVLSHVYLHQKIKDTVAGQAHGFALGTNTYYRNLQQLYLPVETQRKLMNYDATDDDLMLVFDQICEQVMAYFPLYDVNKFREKLVASREEFAKLPLSAGFDEHGKMVQIDKQMVIQRILVGLHANATMSDLKPLGLKTPFGKLQVPNGLKLTERAKIVFESPTGLFKRVYEI